MKNQSLLGTAVGVVVSVAILSVPVYYASRAWKKGQEGQKLI